MTKAGITIRLRVDDIRSTGRSTQGVKAINLSDDDRVASVEGPHHRRQRPGVMPKKRSPPERNRLGHSPRKRCVPAG